MRVGSEIWDDGNTVNGDGWKTPGSDGETSNRSSFSMGFWINQNRPGNLILRENCTTKYISKNQNY